MDKFNRKKSKHIGPGGIKCWCCNYYHGKSKAQLNRLARRTLKQEDRNAT